MSNQEPTSAEVGHSLAVFGNYRVLRTQQLCEQEGNFPHPSTAMGLGLRETGLTNVCGGAIMVKGVWVQSFTDRGCFQINEWEAKAWLASVPGCPEGQWSPEAGHNALEPHFCPRFSDSLEYVLKEFKEHKEQAAHVGVKAEDVERFCVAAHNAGFEGALEGYRVGNVDLNTAHGNYSAWVERYAQTIHTWVVGHPAWVYHAGMNIGAEG